MNGESSDKTEHSDSALEAPAATAAEAQSEAASEAPSKQPSQLTRLASLLSNRAAVIAAGAAALVLLAAAVVYFSGVTRTKAPPGDGPAGSAGGEIAAPETIELPLAAEEPGLAAPATLAPATPADKILNSAGDVLKSGADAVKGAKPSGGGAISALPPPPASGGVNDSLQRAAKDAAALASKKADSPAEIDLSQPDAAMKSLERAASSALEDEGGRGVPPAVENPVPVEADRAPGARAESRPLVETQTAEIDRLHAELAALRARSESAEKRARAALSFVALAQAAQSGAPYRQELEAYAALSGATPLVESLAARADAGLPTPAALKQSFAPARNEALAIARRSAAKGPAARVAANLAALIHLRPAGSRAGDDTIAAISRIEAKLEEGDLAGSLAEARGLEGAPRAPLAAWMSEAGARVAADEALLRAGRAHAATIGAERAVQ